MIIKALLFGICLFPEIVLGQTKYSFKAGIGIARLTCTDHLINHYNYHKNGLFAVNASGYYHRHKQLYLLALSMFEGNLKPINYDETLYSYNFIKHKSYSAKLKVMHLVPNTLSNVLTYLGIGLHGNYNGQKEFYKNLLYTSASGYRTSYCISANLSLESRVTYAINPKNKLSGNIGIAWLSLCGRPDAYTVNQSPKHHSPNWDCYTMKDYLEWNCLLEYSYAIKNDWEIAINLMYEFEDLESGYVNTYQSQSLYVSFTKHFK